MPEKISEHEISQDKREKHIDESIQKIMSSSRERLVTSLHNLYASLKILERIIHPYDYYDLFESEQSSPQKKNRILNLYVRYITARYIDGSENPYPGATSDFLTILRILEQGRIISQGHKLKFSALTYFAWGCIREYDCDTYAFHIYPKRETLVNLRKLSISDIAIVVNSDIDDPKSFADLLGICQKEGGDIVKYCVEDLYLYPTRERLHRIIHRLNWPYAILHPLI